MPQLLTFADAPENVKKLSFAIMESIGPSGIPEIEPKAFLSVGERAGLDADSQAAGFRWLAQHYKSGGNKLLRRVSKHFEAFAAQLERASRVNAPATSVEESGVPS